MTGQAVDRFAWIAAVMERTDLQASAQCVGWALAQHANQKRNDGRVWPSVGTLSKKSGKPERTVSRGLAALVEAGFLVRVRHGGVDHATVYRLALPEASALSTGVDKAAPAATHGSSSPGDLPPPVTDLPPPRVVPAAVGGVLRGLEPGKKGEGVTERDRALLRDGCRSSRHPPGNPEDIPCRGCGLVRILQAEAEKYRLAAETDLAERAAAIVKGCPACGGRGWTETADDRAVRCEHPALAEQLQALERANAGWRPAASKVPA